MEPVLDQCGQCYKITTNRQKKLKYCCELSKHRYRSQYMNFYCKIIWQNSHPQYEKLPFFVKLNATWKMFCPIGQIKNMLKPNSRNFRKDIEIDKSSERNSVKAFTTLELLSQFHEIFVKIVLSSVYVCRKTRNSLSHCTEKIFRQINSLVILI